MVPEPEDDASADAFETFERLQALAFSAVKKGTILQVNKCSDGRQCRAVVSAL